MTKKEKLNHKLYCITGEEYSLGRSTIEVVKEMDAKYRAGYKIHKGNLMDLSLEELLKEALAENIDQCFYIKAALKKIKNT